MGKRSINMDYVFLTIFLIGLTIVMAIEIVFADQASSPRETILYNILTLIFSIGIGWILQRIESQKQYQENIKKFALSAYRRISDINKLVSRFLYEIDKIKISYEDEMVHELDVLRMIAEAMDDTVKSSIADWADILGEELSTKEKIESLQREQQILKMQRISLEDNPQINQRLDELKIEINNLKSELPYLLRDDITKNQYSDGTFQTADDLSSIVIRHFYLEVKSHSYITIQIKPLIDISLKENLEKIMHGKPYSLKVEKSVAVYHAYLQNCKNELIGEIINPFPSVTDDLYIHTFISLIGSISKLTGTLSWLPDLSKDIILSDAELGVMPELGDKEILLNIPANENDFAYG